MQEASENNAFRVLWQFDCLNERNSQAEEGAARVVPNDPHKKVHLWYLVPLCAGAALKTGRTIKTAEPSGLSVPGHRPTRERGHSFARDRFIS